MSLLVKDLYTFDDKQWRTYQLDYMTEAQLEVVIDTCPKEAVIERVKGGLLGGGGAVILLTTGLAIIPLTKIALAALSALTAQMGALFEVGIPMGVVVFVQCFGLGGLFPMLTYAVMNFCKEAIKRITDSWKYADHLDQQWKDARLQQAKLKI